MTGGVIPAAMRGTTSMEMLHVADWYATFCYLAGVDAEDPNTVRTTSDGAKYPMPGVDSLNLWCGIALAFLYCILMAPPSRSRLRSAPGFGPPLDWCSINLW